jgi:RNA polymerase sigma-70 factor (ECF subfamily)
VYNIVYRVISDENEAADITQEVFVRVYKSINKLKAEEAFFTWLRTVAVNICRDRIRRKPAVRVESLDERVEFDGGELDREVADWSANPEKLYEKKDLQGVVQKALSTLSDDHRTVVILHHLEGMDVQQMSKLLGSPEGTIKSRLARARDELKRKLGGYVNIG